jgi:hypothetical protein
MMQFLSVGNQEVIKDPQHRGPRGPLVNRLQLSKRRDFKDPADLDVPKDVRQERILIAAKSCYLNRMRSQKSAD